MSTCSSSLLSADMLAVPAQRMDPQLRKLLEVAYEAWIDSGINHLALRGSERVGPCMQSSHTQSKSAQAMTHLLPSHKFTPPCCMLPCI